MVRNGHAGGFSLADSRRMIILSGFQAHGIAVQNRYRVKIRLELRIF